MGFDICPALDVPDRRGIQPGFPSQLAAGQKAFAAKFPNTLPDPVPARRFMHGRQSLHEAVNPPGRLRRIRGPHFGNNPMIDHASLLAFGGDEAPDPSARECGEAGERRGNTAAGRRLRRRSPEPRGALDRLRRAVNENNPMIEFPPRTLHESSGEGFEAPAALPARQIPAAHAQAGLPAPPCLRPPPRRLDAAPSGLLHNLAGPGSKPRLRCPADGEESEGALRRARKPARDRRRSASTRGPRRVLSCAPLRQPSVPPGRRSGTVPTGTGGRRPRIRRKAETR